jgi:hypothetical protein
MGGGLHYRAVADLPAGFRRQAEQRLGIGSPKPKFPTKRSRNKYNAERTKVGSILFDSKREALYFMRLKAEQAAGKIHHFHRQVTFDLPGDVRYLCDFLIFDSLAQPPRYVDVKGVRTPTFALKRKQVRALYGVEIELA